MSRHHFEGLLLPAPIFEHLTRRLDEISLHSGSGEARRIGPCADVVDDVPELVEEGDHLVVVEQGGLRGSRLCKICQHCTYSDLKRIDAKIMVKIFSFPNRVKLKYNSL
jgi:hypothetical protein